MQQAFIQVHAAPESYVSKRTLACNEIKDFLKL
jgi:hypothetical protein